MLSGAQGLVVDPEYAPYMWRLSEKSDIWALGLIAHKMMYAYCTDTVEDPESNETVLVEDYTLSKEGTWKNVLRKRKIDAHESHFDASATNINHLPDGYSARLCLLAAQCLRHDIDARPDLETLLNLCQQELTRLENLPGSTVGKRKRDDDGDDETTLLVGKEPWNQKFNKYRVGAIYQPKRPRTKVDLSNTHPHRVAYTRLVDAWSNMPRPTSHAQNTVIDTIDWCLLNYEHGHPMVNSSEEYDWAVKHLVSCLRKRTLPESGAYTLSEEYIEDNNGDEWIDMVFEPEMKIRILEYLLTISEVWNDSSVLQEEGAQNATNALRNVVDWGLMMLRDTVTPVVTDAEGNLTGGDPAEPREPRMEGQSALHKGMYDWIFVKPTGAFYKG